MNSPIFITPHVLIEYTYNNRVKDYARLSVYKQLFLYMESLYISLFVNFFLQENC